MERKNMRRKCIPICLTVLLLAATVPATAQRTLSLEECRQMAVENDKSLSRARTEVEMARYDRNIARANYFPNISATGAYLYNDKSINLISSDASARLQNMGTTVHGQTQAFSQGLMQAITSNPAAAKEYMTSPMWQTVLGALSQADLSEVLNTLGREIDEAFHPDMQDVFAGVVSVQQPVFMGGKIVAANRIASLAEELSRTRYDQQYQDVILNVDQTYWQIVSLAAKQKLAQTYADLLHQMEHDVDLSVKEGVATEADALQIKVKANEADMLLTKAVNGLSLSKMLLCKQVGLPLEEEIVLTDELADEVPVAQLAGDKDIEAVYADRPETRSLDLAAKIYDKKVAVARADMLPKVALTANYVVTNPNLYNGFQKDWGGMLNAGVMVNVPIFHAFEAQSRTRKAKAEATLYRTQLEEAKELIQLQVTQLRKQEKESYEKLTMAGTNLDSAEENLRTATVGFEEGVIDANTALAAQTAWLKAHSEYIDAGIELQMLAASLDKAEGNHVIEK